MYRYFIKEENIYAYDNNTQAELISKALADGFEEITKAKVDEINAEKQAEREKEEIGQLHVTRGDMFEALILARQITKPQIRAMIEQYVTEPVQQALFLNRFDEALDFYRGYPVFDMLGAVIGITPEQWDEYFKKATNEETKVEAYKELLPVGDTDHSDQSGDMVDEETGGAL